MKRSYGEFLFTWIRVAVFFAAGIPVSVVAQIPEIESGRPPREASAKCRGKNGILIYQGDVVACFDPKRGIVNNGFSTMPGHEDVAEKEDFDQLTGKPIKFYRHFKEIEKLTVCNYTGRPIFIAIHRMPALATPTVEDATLQPDVCKSGVTHMFTAWPDRKSAEEYLSILAATPRKSGHIHHSASPPQAVD